MRSGWCSAPPRRRPTPPSRLAPGWQRGGRETNAATIAECRGPHRPTRNTSTTRPRARRPTAAAHRFPSAHRAVRTASTARLARTPRTKLRRPRSPNALRTLRMLGLVGMPRTPPRRPGTSKTARASPSPAGTAPTGTAVAARPRRRVWRASPPRTPGGSATTSAELCRPDRDRPSARPTPGSNPRTGRPSPTRSLPPWAEAQIAPGSGRSLSPRRRPPPPAPPLR